MDERPDRVPEAPPQAPPDWATPATQAIGPPFTGPLRPEEPIAEEPTAGLPEAGPRLPGAQRIPGAAGGPSRRQVWLILVAVVLLLVCFWGAVALTAITLIRNLAVEVGPGDHRTVGLNQPTRDGGLEFQVRTVECGIDTVGDPLINRTAVGQFCLVRLTVRNVGGRPVSFIDALQEAYGPAGETYQADSVAGILANADQQGFLDEINPGNRVTGALVYDIPPGASIVQLRLRQSPTSKGAPVRVR